MFVIFSLSELINYNDLSYYYKELICCNSLPIYMILLGC